MKNYTLLTFTVLVYLCTINSYTMAQSSGNNMPGVGKYLGFSGAQNLEFRTNNIIRMQLTETSTSTINGFTIDNSGFLGLSANPTFFTTSQPFALLHLNGINSLGVPQQNGYRTWMQHGIVSTHNQDLMFIGQKSNADDVTDAVIGWADNGVGVDGPDNLVFIYTAGDGLGGAGDPQSLSDDGLELARMIPEGFTGIGTDWTNTVAPKRTLDVVFEDDEPQFRLTRTNSTQLTLGAYADFEVSTAGHLHILPRNGATRNVGIGYLSGAGTPTERLDVDGTARLRDMTENAGNVLITGVEETAAGDYALNYLIFSGEQGEYLAGDGSWQDVGSTLCEWNVNAGDLMTGYGGACNEGDVSIGSTVFQPNTELTVFKQSDGATSVQGIHSSVNNNTIGSTATAVHGYARSVVDGTAPDFEDIIGVCGIANVGQNCFQNAIGVYGEAIGN